MRKHYTFYESFYYRNNTSMRFTITVLCHKVTCYINPDERFKVKMLKKGKYCGVSYSPKTNKLYHREVIRKVRVVRINNHPYDYENSRLVTLASFNKTTKRSYLYDEEGNDFYQGEFFNVHLSPLANTL